MLSFLAYKLDVNRWSGTRFSLRSTSTTLSRDSSATGAPNREGMTSPGLPISICISIRRLHADEDTRPLKIW